jgi:ferredoxin
MPLGYECVVYEALDKPGGLMRSNIPAFRLPASVLDEEMGYIIDMGVDLRLRTPVQSMHGLLEEGYDAVFIGSGAPKGKDLGIPGRDHDDNIHIGIQWLESVAFGHVDKIGERVLIIGVGNTAMDCCRTSLRLGAKNVKVMARKPREFFKASDWELEDAEEEAVEIIVNHSPKAFVIERDKLVGMTFERMEYDIDASGRITDTRIVGEVTIPCDDVVLAIGQDNAFPWIERDLGIEFDKWEVPVVDAATFESTRPGVFFGGDAAFGPKNIIWAVEHGHQAAISIHKYCQGTSLTERLPRGVTLQSAKMGIHEWSYSNDFDPLTRRLMPNVDLRERFKKLDIEVELGFSAEQAASEVERCLNCDLQTVFFPDLCIECDACIDICPVDCLTITANADEEDLKKSLKAPILSPEQPFYVSAPLKQTGRVMVKDENICVHCGLCAERCPTSAWDMQKSTVSIPYAIDEMRQDQAKCRQQRKAG